MIASHTRSIIYIHSMTIDLPGVASSKPKAGDPSSFIVYFHKIGMINANYGSGASYTRSCVPRGLERCRKKRHRDLQLPIASNRLNSKEIDNVVTNKACSGGNSCLVAAGMGSATTCRKATKRTKSSSGGHRSRCYIGPSSGRPRQKRTYQIF